MGAAVLEPSRGEDTARDAVEAAVNEAVRVEGLCHVYDRRVGPVLQDVDAVFGFGSVVALWGPSGSGKSTLLSLLGLLMAPTSGTVTVAGCAAWASSGQARRLRRSMFAWVLQNSACLEARSALDNVAMGPLAEGLGRREAAGRAVEALEVVGLAGRAGSRAVELSGGELQRMTVARALAADRPVVLADEPTGQLDAKSSGTVADALRALAAAGRCVIVATHDPAVSQRCDAVFPVASTRAGS